MGFDPFMKDLAALGSGGSPFFHYYDPADLTELRSALVEVLESLAFCEFQVSADVIPENIPAGGVTLDSQPIEYDDPNGWTLVAPNMLRLLGSACDHAKYRALVDLRFSCEGVN